MRWGVQCQRGVREWPSEKDISVSFLSTVYWLTLFTDPNSIKKTLGICSTSPFALSFVPPYGFQISFLLRTGFPHVWDRMLLINSRVKAAEPCKSEKHPGTSTRESQTIWESRPLLERNGNVLFRRPFSHTALTLDTPSHLMILKSSTLLNLSLSYFYEKVYLSPN